MGRATIVSGGVDGRYVIEMDFGSDLKTRILNALSVVLATLDTRILQQQSDIADAQVLEDAQKVRYDAAVEQFIALHQAFAPGSPEPSDAAVKFELANLRRLQQKHTPLRTQLALLKFHRAGTLKRIAYWNNFEPLERRPAWCVDLTETAAPGAVVATAEIPGETALMLIAPGARAPVAADGQLMAREVMSPEQAFWNAAVLPGWQKEKPTYRWGTLTAVDQVANTCSVSLAAATSSAKSLNVNRDTALSNVPIVYMDCNALPFEIGARVVVRFTGQSWGSPVVIGFLDNPKLCNWTIIHATANAGGAGSEVWFESLSESVMDEIFAGGVTFEARVNGGAWVVMSNWSGAYPTQTQIADTSTDIFRALYYRGAGSVPTTTDDQVTIDIPGVGLNTFNKAVISLQVQRYEDGFGAPPNIRVVCQPYSYTTLPIGGGFIPDRVKETCEWRLRVPGVLLFNVAAHDARWAGESPVGVYRVKSRSAVRLRSIPGQGPTDTVLNDLPYALAGLD